MKTLITLVTLLSLTIYTSGQGLVNVNPDPEGEPWLAGGLRELTTGDYARIAATPRLNGEAVRSNRDLPASLDNTVYPWFRPIFNQDGGSCGQASGIGYNFTYEMDYVRGIAANTTETQYPTHYTWNFLNGGGGGGSWYFDGWQIIAANGCPNVSTYGGTPWYGGDRRWMSGYENYLAGMQNRILEVATIDVSTEEGLITLKQWLFDRLDGSPSGGLANFSAGVSDAFTMDYLPSGTPNAGKQVVTRWGEQVNHAMTFVGYDDNIRYDFNGDGLYTNDLDITGDGITDLRDYEIGGLIMVNSWGQSFGDNGKAYVMYRTLAFSLAEGGIWNNLLHVIRARADYQPLITLKATVKHTSREKVKISAGVSAGTSDTKPAHLLEFPMFSYQGGNYYMSGGSSENDKSIEIGLDVTPLLSYIEPGQTSRFFIQIEEQDPDGSSAGQITSVSLFDLNTSAEFPGQQTNLSLINNDTTYAWTDAAVNFIPTEITTQTLPPATAGVAYSHQLEASGAQAPYKWSLIQQFTEHGNQAAFPSITSGQLIPSDNDDGFATQTIDFAFPFYGQTYQDLVITTDGSIAFSGQFEYVRSEASIRSSRVITPYGADLMIYPEYNDGIFYEGDATHATFRWKISKFNEPSFNNDFAVTLYPDGTIKFYYGNGITPATDWASGISAGDGQNYLLASVSGSSQIIPGSSFRFTCPQLPSGMQLSEDGLFSGTPQQSGQVWPLTFRALSANGLFDTRSLEFTTDSELTLWPDTLTFEDDIMGWEGLSFYVTNDTDHEVTLTHFDYEGSIVLQDGEWEWETWFTDPMPYTMAPGSELQIVVSLKQSLLMSPMAGYAVDTLNFGTATEDYRVILVFNDTINIYNSVNELTTRENRIQIYPNPAITQAIVTFDADAQGEATFCLYNSTGLCVRTDRFTSLQEGKVSRPVDLTGLNPGMYAIKLRTATETYTTKLLIVR